MIINYDKQKLTSALYDFYYATGIVVDLMDTDFQVMLHIPVKPNNYCRIIQQTPGGIKRCEFSNYKLLCICRESKKPEMHICHAGLVDVAVPIIFDDEIICYAMLGQMKNNHNFSEIKKLIGDLPIDTKEAEKHYMNNTPFDYDKVKGISSLAIMLTKYIIFENMLKPSYNKSLSSAIAYIDSHLDEKITIESLADGINICKSTLYKDFRKEYDCTVSEYINKKRIEKSTHYLIHTGMSMEDISQTVGFSSASYYSKQFKKQKGMSPLKYRSTFAIQKK